jgi:hypothetical protein
MYMPKTNPEGLIKKALKSGRKTPSELKQLCLNGISKQTYHRHLSKLVKRGEVKHENYYELITRSVERNEVLGIIGEIDNTIEDENWGKCSSLIASLRHICRNYRTGHIPELFEALKKYVDTPKLFENDGSRFELAFMMQYILRNEIDSGLPRNANQIKTVLLEPVCKIALHPDKNSRTRALSFLCETESKRSVDTIIEILVRSDDQQIDQIEDTLRQALFRSNLAKKQARYIRKKLMELSGYESEPVRLRVQRLLKMPI